jgi:hypothetical protein
MSAGDLWSLIECRDYDGWLERDFNINNVPPTLAKLEKKQQINST